MPLSRRTRRSRRCPTPTNGPACLADDSGLEVDWLLDGRPGVISSHYCTDGRDVGMTREHRDHANNERLMRDMSGAPNMARTARFVCVMAVGLPADGGAGGTIPIRNRRPRNFHGANRTYRRSSPGHQRVRVRPPFPGWPRLRAHGSGIDARREKPGVSIRRQPRVLSHASGCCSTPCRSGCPYRIDRDPKRRV